MRGAAAARGILWLCVTALGLGGLASPASAVDFFDGRVEAHGFYESQIRSIVRDYDFSDDWDLTQWWHIFNVEIDVEIAPDGIGPFDVVTMFARIEVRYDCVWTQACTLFDAADAYRIGHKRRIPKRLIDARRTGFQGTNFVGDRRHFYDVPYQRVSSSSDPDINQRPDGSRVPLEWYQNSVGDGFFASTGYGPDTLPAIPENRAMGNRTEPLPGFDDPGFFIYQDMFDDNCDEWGQRAGKGNQDGRGEGSSLLLNPACDFQTISAVSNYPNPFNPNDFNPLVQSGGSAALPYRPAPMLDADSTAPLEGERARGLYYPNYRLQQLIRDGDFDNITNKLTRSELAWNRGDSQQDQKELKELYFEFEMFDSRLWVRAGYQTIVWGKTELFRNQDQFNPQDLALASLPSLEESRISLWAVRAIWSFYEVGPFNDVRLEIAANFDDYQSNDLGLCGEPYTPLAACALSTGQIAHSYLGIGLAGAVLPPNAWNSWKGIEAGARLEWRWDRFSFAITDFYGYQDLPYVDLLFNYTRNVDPISGRPRHTVNTGRCRDGDESNCLKAEDTVRLHHANQTLFATTCAATLAVAPDLDPTACLANIFGSPARTDEPGVLSPRIVVALNTIVSGDTADPNGLVLPGLAGYTPATTAAIQQFTQNGSGKVVVPLNFDVNDGAPDIPANHPLQQETDFGNTVAFFLVNLSGSVSARLTDEQEALLGCGPFYGTSCDLDGLDLLNAEASAFYQSWPLVQGTFSRDPNDRWDTTDNGRAQPGTLGFEGGPACSRYENGKTYILPGCRGPGDPGYDPRVDGTTTNLVHPFTGQQFANEMAALSWNALMANVGLSGAADPNNIRPAEFDPNDPFRENGCSFRQPQWCGNVTGLLSITGVRRNTINAGGNGRFGRRDFAWHTGGTGVLRVDKSNILGFSMDFAEDVTKSNWGVEFTWVNNVHAGNNNAFDGLSIADFYRLTISVDRPTFVNFLNANRTFFINSQWFFQYTENYVRGFTGDGPWNIFGVVAISTGYFQDRLLPSLTMVYFVMNNSLAILPSITYRFNEAFSATFGLAAFAGRQEDRIAPLTNLSPEGERFGRNANKSFVENGLAVVRERDEIFLRIRYTF